MKRLPNRGSFKPSHGMARTPEYRSWSHMKSRCANPKDPDWKMYGGRGIAVCERWTSSFLAFLEDVGLRPSSEHSLDRFPDRDGNYEPGNVRWANPTEQSRNRDWGTFVEHDGDKVRLSILAEGAGLTAGTIRRRIARGWKLETALSVPHGTKILHTRKDRAGFASQFIGVSIKSGRRRKWKAHLWTGHKLILIGTFMNEIDAAQAYNFAAEEFFGEHAEMNLPQQNDGRYY